MGFLRTVIFGLLLLASHVAHAETINATLVQHPAIAGHAINNGWYSGTPTEACFKFGGAAYSVQNGNCANVQYPSIFYGIIGMPSCGPEGAAAVGTCPATYECPANQNWTLSGTTCTRPECPAGQTRQSNGTCLDTCAAKAQEPPVTGWYSSAVGQPSLESSQYCDAGCTVGLNASPTGTSYVNKNMRWQKYSKVQLGYACSAGLAAAPATGADGAKPPEPEKPPPCSPAEGVLTSSSGTVACVPAGTPGSGPPLVSKQKEVTPYPDGSAKAVETITTRDPQTGAEHKGTIITISPATGGGAGMAGTPGTSAGPSSGSSTTTGGDGTKPGDSDFCNKNPGLQICKGGMNEEVTQKKVQESLETAFNTEGVTNDEITNKEVDEAKKQEAEDAFEAIKDKLSGGTDAADKQAQFSDAVSTWFDPVPPGSCAALTATVGGRVFTLDPCPTAQKVSDIGAYALWVYLAFGTLVLVTRKAE